MTKNQPRGEDDNEKVMKATIQKRFEKMFSGKGQPLSNISLQEAEALKARVAELEDKLTQQGTATLKTTTFEVAKVSDIQPLSPKPVAETQKTSSQKFASNALRISQISFIASMIAALFYLYLALQLGAWQLYAWSVDIWILALVALIDIILVRRGHAARAIWVLLVAISITFIGAIALIEGIGLLLGVSIVVLISIIAGQTLPAKAANRAIIFSAVSGVVAVLLDLFLPAYRFPQPEPVRIFLPIILGVVILLFGYMTIRQFRNYSLRTKMIMVFTITVVSILGIVAFLTNRELSTSLTENIGSNLAALANSKAIEIGQIVNRESDVLKSLALNKSYQNAAKDATETNVLSKTEIERLDREWRDADVANNNTDSLVAGVLYNDIASELRQFQKQFPQHVEVFLTDRQGVNIAATNRTSDYYQADEEWWKTAYKEGLFIGQPEYDESSKTIAITMATPVRANGSGEIVGILRTTVNFEALSDSLIAGLFGQSGHTDIYLPNGQEIELETREDGSLELALREAELDINLLTQSKEPYLEISHNGVPALASQAVVSVPADVNEGNTAISKLNWRVVTIQNQAEALLPVAVQRRNFLLLAIALSITAALAAIGLAQLLTGPLTRLTVVANQIAGGNLSAQAQVETGDETGILATTFNNMTSQLRNLFGSLEQRVLDRTHDLELASEVGRTITERVANLDELLTAAVEMIRVRFELYYTQVYLTDPTGHSIVLRAGTGEVGEKLFQQGHRLLISSGSLNGRAVVEKKPIIVADTRHSANFMPNVLLPNTRSEMAVPLIAGGQVLGVLDMQSEQPGALNETNLPAFEALSGQLAIAIQNAALFAEAKEARSEAESQVRRLTEQGWQDFLNAIDRGQKMGFASDQSNVIRLKTEALSTSNQGKFTLPIIITGAKVGEISLPAEHERSWTNNELELVQTTSTQLAQHIENLRLLAQAEQFRKIAEQAARRLTREGWDSFLENRNQAESAYIYDLNEVRPFSGNGSHRSEKILKQFLVVQDETIGELTVDEAGNSDEAAEILAAVAGQLSSHVENLRLFEQTQSALATTQASETALTEVMIVANMSNWELDINAMKFTFSDRFYNMVGTTVEEMGGYEVSVSDYLQEFVHPEDVNIVSTAIQEALQYPDSQNFRGHIEYRLIHKDGQLRHVTTDYRLTIDDDKKPIGGFGSFLDITERKKAEEIVRLAQQRAQTILDSVTVPMVITRLSDNHLTFVNRPAIEVTQFKYEDVIDRPSPDFYYNLDDRKKFISELRAKGNVADMVVQLRRQNGEPFWALLSARLFDYQNEASIVSTFMDITDRIRAQEAVAKRAAELQTVAEVSTTTATTLEPDRLLQTVVDLTKERFGLYHAHIYLANESWNTLLLAAGAGEVGRKLVAEEHAIPMNLEHSLVARAARERSSIIVNDVKNEPGFLPNPLLPETLAEMAVPMIVAGVVLGVFDVQSNNQQGFSAEDASIYITLASQVAVALQNARLYVEQAAAVTQLRELDRLKSSFLANMSHELRTPLNSILGFADVILEELDGPLTDYMNNDLRLIQKNGQHLLHLINDVLDMAKIEAGRMNLNPEKFRIYEVLDEVTSITSTLASEKNLSLFIDEESDQEAEIYADHTRLRQVMINLVNNAIKFTEIGKIAVKVTSIEGARVLISVKDTGIGISPDKLEAVFQEFTQVDTSSTRKAGGTGLGLPISRRLVEMHGGRLWAESTGVNGEGSTFFVELPIEARITDVIEKQAK